MEREISTGKIAKEMWGEASGGEASGGRHLVGEASGETWRWREMCFAAEEMEYTKKG